MHVTFILTEPYARLTIVTLHVYYNSVCLVFSSLTKIFLKSIRNYVHNLNLIQVVCNFFIPCAFRFFISIWITRRWHGRIICRWFVLFNWSFWPPHVRKKILHNICMIFFL